MDLVRVTEAAAIAAASWVGSGDKENADRVASEAIKDRLNKISAKFKIVIGEGIKDKSYGLFKGEVYGSPSNWDEHTGQYGGSVFDAAIDPIEGTRPTVTSGPEAISTIGIAGENCLFNTEEFYMHKLAYGPNIRKHIKISIKDSIEEIVSKAKYALKKRSNHLMVCVLDRPRHEDIIKELRRLAVRIKLIQDCDVSGAIAACMPDSGIDIMYGIGGAPEGVLSACAIKCLGGDLQARVSDKDGKNLDDKVLELEDLAKGTTCFAATGITDGSLLKGVRFGSKGPITNSVFMRSESGTVRFVDTLHGN